MKTYSGDGAYAEFDQHGDLVLTTEDGISRRPTNVKLIATLPRDRTRQGRIALLNEVGELFSDRCLGKADNLAAKAHGNPTRDPAKPWGDTPLGTFITKVRHFTTPLPEAQEHSYGPYGWCVWSVGNRVDLGVHGGDLALAQRLRPTHGCIRTTNEFMRKLLDKCSELGLTELSLEVREEEKADDHTRRDAVTTLSTLPS